MRPATIIALALLLVLLVGAALLQLVFKVGGEGSTGGRATVPVVSTTQVRGDASATTLSSVATTGAVS